MSLEEGEQVPSHNDKDSQCDGTDGPWIQNDPKSLDHHWSWPGLHNTIDH